jgi:23S rRNA (uracil1939-C5)-methyltransferase
LAQTETILAGARRIVDLFAGCGTFALPLAQRAQVHAVEGEAEMLAALDAGRRGAAGLYPLSTEARDLFRRPLLADELARYDGAVIDPPRAGAEAQIAEIARASLPRLAYVSCNPVTFARDAKTLIAAGYAMGAVRVVDQFRWSAHVELVAGFTLNKA